jgi:hypothetical protein
VRSEVLGDRRQALSAAHCVFIDSHGRSQRTSLLLDASSRLVRVGGRFVLVCSIGLCRMHSFGLPLFLFWFLIRSREVHSGEFCGNVVDDTHGLLFSGFHGGSVGGALHGTLVGELGGEQVGIRPAPDLFVGHFLFQCRHGVLVQIHGAEALCPALKGTGALGRTDDVIGERSIGRHGRVYDVDEA